MNYVQLIGRKLQDKHDHRNKAYVTGFRKKGKNGDKLWLQIDVNGKRKWKSVQTVTTYWEFL